ncbi:MAG: hypothetical protein SV062_09320 [Thermodesulfobacteriota bacterium]|nr:hypothetical protein [Thermodesulfobacteriota bacterium]
MKVAIVPGIKISNTQRYGKGESKSSILKFFISVVIIILLLVTIWYFW